MGALAVYGVGIPLLVFCVLFFGRNKLSDPTFRLVHVVLWLSGRNLEHSITATSRIFLCGSLLSWFVRWDSWGFVNTETERWRNSSIDAVVCHFSLLCVPFWPWNLPNAWCYGCAPRRFARPVNIWASLFFEDYQIVLNKDDTFGRSWLVSDN